MNPNLAYCNKCFLIPRPGIGSKYFLTSCGNVYCEKCLSQGGCKKCGKNNCSSRVISHPSVITFFQDNAAKVSSILKSLNFQSKRYQVYHKYTEARHSHMVRAIKEKDNKIQALENQITEWQNANNKIKSDIRQMQKQRQQMPEQNYTYQMPAADTSVNDMEFSFATTAVKNAITSDHSPDDFF